MADDSKDRELKNIVAVCISRQEEAWPISEIPFYCHTLDWKPFGHDISKDRVAYLAGRRNAAISRALSLFANAEHILMIDSYYLGQRSQILELVSEYGKLLRSERRDHIVGGSTWIVDKTKIRPTIRFYDTWTTPEGSNLSIQEAEKKRGFREVRAVGGCYLYPRFVLEKVRYGVPDDLHGCEHNWLCERSGLPVLLSLEVRLWREPIVYPWAKRLRWSLHLGRLVPGRASGKTCS